MPIDVTNSGKISQPEKIRKTKVFAASRFYSKVYLFNGTITDNMYELNSHWSHKKLKNEGF